MENFMAKCSLDTNMTEMEPDQLILFDLYKRSRKHMECLAVDDVKQNFELYEGYKKTHREAIDAIAALIDKPDDYVGAISFWFERFIAAPKKGAFMNVEAKLTRFSGTDHYWAHPSLKLADAEAMKKPFFKAMLFCWQAFLKGKIFNPGSNPGNVLTLIVIKQIMWGIAPEDACVVSLKMAGDATKSNKRLKKKFDFSQVVKA